ncbi:MAG: ParA family protein [Lachnospiraceae bacterium]|nr:ParA family protein [Lachnospiraceae bacterium]
MSRIIAVANQKGGVGKTTTVINLSASLAEQGQRVLMVDLDPQGNASSDLGIEKDRTPATVYDLILGNCRIEDCIFQSVMPGVHVIPSTVHLAGAEVELIGTSDSQYRIRQALAGIRDRYDFILMDCPPSLNILTVNAMTAADSVLVPIQCEYYALEGLSQLMYTISLVQKSLNPSLGIEGVVFTMYDARTNLSLQVVENVKQNLRQRIYRTIIPRNVRLAEAPSHGLPINLYDPRSSGADSYRRLAQEVIQSSGAQKTDD